MKSKKTSRRVSSKDKEIYILKFIIKGLLKYLGDKEGAEYWIEEAKEAIRK